MKKFRKNNKGFSLVELIIVVAIMVALIAVLAPQYIKYVQSSRDAVLESAGEEVLSVVKAEIALGHIENDAEFTVTVDSTGIGEDDIDWANNADGTLATICEVATDRIKSDKTYTITVTPGSFGLVATGEMGD
ncbi:MAG: prepilin-type N-terminal cleavage/methylation domain-containing protein [Oscillospiraceae bacterium]|nr:prepilin-type N-terminal cleavage/methylation domain-containing protein [Oscillospiraceae bacterium]